MAERSDPRPALGYAMVTAAAILFAVNGTVSKVALVSGLTSLRLSEIRTTGALLGLALLVVATRPRSLRVTRRELPILVLFGILGVSLVQLLYFLSIRRLPIGIALVIQYLAPLLIALWARFVMHEPVRRRIWVALALALAGLTLVVDIWGGVELDAAGIAFALLCAMSFATYLLLAERTVEARDPVSLLTYGFFFGSLFWACVQPWWTFPQTIVSRDVSLLGHLAEIDLPLWALLGWIIALGTVVPFVLIVGALRHLSATRVGIVAMLEPVGGTIIAYAWLGESLGAMQFFGGAVVLSAILLAQTAR